ncbi:MAG: MBL fold metallo-hydrolase [Myxococcota bacterium]
MSGDAILHAGTATLALELGGLRILTDPAFDPAGREYRVGADAITRNFRYSNLAGSALPVKEVGPVDLLLLSHDQHDDNLDVEGRAILEDAKLVLTTRAAQKRLKKAVTALQPFESTTVDLPSGKRLKITATPARHGPPMSEWLVGEVIGFVLEVDDGRPPIYISGDTVLFGGIEEVARRFKIGTAILHVGAATFSALGLSVRFTMDGPEAAKAAKILGAPKVIPIHYAGWSHFRAGRREIEDAFVKEGIADRLKWLPLGERVPL